MNMTHHGNPTSYGLGEWAVGLYCTEWVQRFITGGKASQQEHIGMNCSFFEFFIACAYSSAAFAMHWRVLL